MKRRLSSRLSPQAKKMILRSPQQTVTGMLELAATGDAEQVQQTVESCGGKMRATPDGSSTVTFEIGAAHLAELADLEGVVYVSTEERYQI